MCHGPCSPINSQVTSALALEKRRLPCSLCCTVNFKVLTLDSDCNQRRWYHPESSLSDRIPITRGEDGRQTVAELLLLLLQLQFNNPQSDIWSGEERPRCSVVVVVVTLGRYVRWSADVNIYTSLQLPLLCCTAIITQ